MIKKYKKPIIVGVVILAIVLIISALSNSTYALFSNDNYGINTEVYSTGMLSIEAKSKSENISLTNALPMSDDDGKDTNPYVFTIKNTGNLDFLFDVKLLSTGSSSTTFLPQYIKLQIDDGDVTTLSALSSGKIKSGITLLAGESIDISIRIWLSIDTPNSELGKSFSSKIVTDGQAIYTNSNNEYSVTLINHIKNLYTSGTPTLITHSKDDGTSDSYYYSYQDTDSTWGLMNDGLTIDTTQDEETTGFAKVVTDTTALTTGSEGNIRYFGPSDKVKNYIYFNCSDYSNQSLTDSNGNKNCELWRIIGIVDGKVKIIRNDTISDLSWDQDRNQDYNLTTFSNNWETSSLQLFLNGPYYNRGIEEIYIYYSGRSGAININVKLNKIGITEATRTNNLISESIWYLGGYSSSSIYSNDIYKYERTNTIGTTIYNDNSFTINANIGMLYPSDYGYGTDLTKCSKKIIDYNDSTNSYSCKLNNWLSLKYNNMWMITPSSLNSIVAWTLSSSGEISYDSGSVYDESYLLRPVLYLESDLKMDNVGEGTDTNPYRISLG